MKGTITLETEDLGPLKVCVHFPMIFYEGKMLEGWSARLIEMMAHLIQYSVLEPDEWASLLDVNTETIKVRLCELRTALKLARLPFRIVTEQASRRQRTMSYRLVFRTDPPGPSNWIDNRKAEHLERTGKTPVIAQAVRRSAT